LGIFLIEKLLIAIAFCSLNDNDLDVLQCGKRDIEGLLETKI